MKFHIEGSRTIHANEIHRVPLWEYYNNSSIRGGTGAELWAGRGEARPACSSTQAHHEYDKGIAAVNLPEHMGEHMGEYVYCTVNALPCIGVSTGVYFGYGAREGCAGMVYRGTGGAVTLTWRSASNLARWRWPGRADTMS